MQRCLISFGANIGDARSSVLIAEQLLRDALPSDNSVQLSRLYHTPAVGGPSGQQPFINAVAAVQTQLNPWEMWHIIRSIEQQLGRRRQRRWEARRIDLDILLFDQLRIWTPHLKIPHPRMCMRRFILQPACDVAADWLDPVSQLTLLELASFCLESNTLQMAASKILLAGNDLSWLSAIADLRNVNSLDCGIDLISLEDLSAQFEQSHSLNETQAEPCISNARHDGLWNPGRLLFVCVGSDEGAAWEDRHRDLAVHLRLCDPVLGRPLPHHTAKNAWPIRGPRYLLATSDANWAAHELEAACNAICCQVQAVG